MVTFRRKNTTTTTTRDIWNWNFCFTLHNQHPLNFHFRSKYIQNKARSNSNKKLNWKLLTIWKSMRGNISFIWHQIQEFWQHINRNNQKIKQKNCESISMYHCDWKEPEYLSLYDFCLIQFFLIAIKYDFRLEKHYQCISIPFSLKFVVAIGWIFNNILKNYINRMFYVMQHT